MHLLSGEFIGDLENAFRHGSGFLIDNQVSEAERMRQLSHGIVLFRLLTAHCSLLTAHCSLLTAHCSLLTAHCSLLTSHNSDAQPFDDTAILQVLADDLVDVFLVDVGVPHRFGVDHQYRTLL